MLLLGRRGPPARPLTLATLLLTACIPSESPTLRSGDPAPDFTATSLDDGSPVSLSDYRGHALLVNLWATWCHPCRAETPYLQSVYERYRDRGLRILGVSVDRRADRSAVIEFVEEFGVEYDIALDPDAVSRDLFHARGLPTSVLFNRDGTVAFSWIGPIPEGDRTFLEGVEAALGPGRLSAAPGHSRPGENFRRYRAAAAALATASTTAPGPPPQQERHGPSPGPPDLTTQMGTHKPYDHKGVMLLHLAFDFRGK